MGGRFKHRVFFCGQWLASQSWFIVSSGSNENSELDVARVNAAAGPLALFGIGLEVVEVVTPAAHLLHLVRPIDLDEDDFGGVASGSFKRFSVFSFRASDLGVCFCQFRNCFPN